MSALVQLIFILFCPGVIERFIVAAGIGAGAIPSAFAYIVVPGREYLLLVESTATI